MLDVHPYIPPAVADWRIAPEAIGPGLGKVPTIATAPAVARCVGPRRSDLRPPVEITCLAELASPRLLADEVARLIREGEAIAGEELALTSTASPRTIHHDTLRFCFEVKVEYTPRCARGRVLTRWRPDVYRVAWFDARCPAPPDPAPATVGRLQSTIDRFAAFAAEVTR